MSTHCFTQFCCEATKCPSPQCFFYTGSGLPKFAYVANPVPPEMRCMTSIIIDNTYCTYNGNIYEQTSGLPMGSSISGILPISFMDQLEHRALSIYPSCIFFTRYIDDILMLTSSSKEATTIYEKHRHIQFKIKHPDNTESLSLLDFKIQISPTGKIYSSFYRKPNTKNLFMHFKSALPLSAKTNYIRNEIKRIHNRCSEEKDKITHTHTHYTLYKLPQKQ